MQSAIVIGDRWRLKTPAPIPFQWMSAYGRCVRCERAYPAIAWVENSWERPNWRCDGTFNDAWEWEPESTLLTVHPEYPELPDEGDL